MATVLTAGCIELPKSQTTLYEVQYLDQGWTQEERDRFYHVSQGTVLMPASWFASLEQPELKFIGSVGLFADDEYMSRFGFLPSHVRGEANPYGFPIGFSTADVTMPTDGSEIRAVGLTCAACHVGQLNYNGQSIRVDGGTSLLGVTEFQTALGFAAFLTAKLPFRFARFAERVLEHEGRESTDEARLELKQQLNEFLDEGLAEQSAARKDKLYDDYPGGFGRTDALARIGNYVYGTELDNVNLVKGDAPVKYPHIWDVSWFSWAQYNGSVEQPMVRNIGEALGVRARVNLDPTSDRFMESTVDVPGLIEIENLLAGETQFDGLNSPQWSEEIFGPIQWGRVEAGRELYGRLCERCHLPPIQDQRLWDDLDPDPNTAAGSRSPGAKKYWISNQSPEMLAGFAELPEERYYLKNSMVDLGVIGTDPGQALGMLQRVVRTPGRVLPSPVAGLRQGDGWQVPPPNWFELAGGVPGYATCGDSPYDNGAAGERSPYDCYLFPTQTMGLGGALQSVTVAIAQQYYDEMGYDTETRRELSGMRNPGAQALMTYRTRPLNGAWAAPPFLHNGSVPTLYQLLSPVEDRDAVFYTGSFDFDPVDVGFDTSYFPGAFRYDTSAPGNSNRGHEFTDGPLGDGVIGPRLTRDERYAIIEFLKTLGPVRPTAQ